MTIFTTFGKEEPQDAFSLSNKPSIAYSRAGNERRIYNFSLVMCNRSSIQKLIRRQQQFDAFFYDKTQQ